MTMALFCQELERPSGETAWTVLDAANDLGDTTTIDACRRVIDADLRGEAPHDRTWPSSPRSSRKARATPKNFRQVLD